jgi:FMN phosphatase YigB (HAD superfamily)
LVDLDGTLYRATPVKVAMGAELLWSGRGVIRVLRRFRHEHEVLRANGIAEGGSPFAVQLDRTARGLGVEQAHVERLVREWMIRRPGRWIRRFCRRELLGEIAAFRSQGGKTALVSDYPALDKLAALDASALFDVIVANGEQGGPSALKPSPAGVRAAAERLGVATGRCLIIGDRDDADGAAARAAGMPFRLIR